MKRSGRVYIVAGVVLALVAGALLFLFLNQVTQQQPVQATPTPLPPVDVVVLSRDLTAGTILNGGMLKRESRKVSDPSVTPETIRDLSEAVDHVILTDMKAGTAVVESPESSHPSAPAVKSLLAVAALAQALTTTAAIASNERIELSDGLGFIVTFRMKLTGLTRLAISGSMAASGAAQLKYHMSPYVSNDFGSQLRHSAWRFPESPCHRAAPGTTIWSLLHAIGAGTVAAE